MLLIIAFAILAFIVLAMLIAKSAIARSDRRDIAGGDSGNTAISHGDDGYASGSDCAGSASGGDCGGGDGGD